ncbi:hypothetical protein ACRE_045670 [Hapsidospora chrysogenum ATCC 11550]|uniref:Uncharacterized protein n=1 Tax=Hapsidospora chrysogenum (strain ATCC 11550 / CBS 779.69 / DSM 880 / IAM 14645 / JCM 23072 / IMI 49137) TaxID=857340 RepID=A0A086T5K4_HAPC1|nr:hypothetical protein ACRE_045670 [Hapsidospora chrysogenum ATCC 11550]
MIPNIAGLAGLALAAAATALAQDACNGHVELCDRRYSDITFAAAHNAAFVGRGPSHNQFVYPEQDMDNGIRYLTTQVHIEDGEIRQCHSDCFLLDVGPFSEMVVSVKNWLDDHPREVVTLLIVNSDDNILIEEFMPAFEDAGAVDMLFQPGGNLALDEWPTLGELIDDGKRFIVFMDYNADLAKVPYIIPEFEHYIETPFSPTSDNFFNCDVHRPSEDAPVDERMIFVNHNLNKKVIGDVLIPDQGAAADTNSEDNILRQTDICVEKHGRNPNVVMLDFVTEGDVIKVQDLLNGL